MKLRSTLFLAVFFLFTSCAHSSKERQPSSYDSKKDRAQIISQLKEVKDFGGTCKSEPLAHLDDPEKVQINCKGYIGDMGNKQDCSITVFAKDEVNTAYYISATIKEVGWSKLNVMVYSCGEIND